MREGETFAFRLAQYCSVGIFPTIDVLQGGVSVKSLSLTLIQTIGQKLVPERLVCFTIWPTYTTEVLFEGKPIIAAIH